MKKLILLIFLVFSATACIHAGSIVKDRFVYTEKGKDYFPMVTGGRAVSLLFDSRDHKGVLLAINSLRDDFKKVTGNEPAEAAGRYRIIIGTAGKSLIIDDLIRTGKLPQNGLSGKNEKFIIQVVKSPLKGVESALVIAGSDKRGTIYGIYELSAQMGVSPWYYWADVPVTRRNQLYVKPGVYTLGEPAVKYRGIFLNDEAPALSGWAHEKFGGFNHRFYEKVFELILRLKGNYLWPAMWGNSFNSDDPENPRLANDMGVIMGTSHHEPMMRAHAEWKEFAGGGQWNYATNASGLDEFWRLGIRRMGNNESVVTIGMRGDGDEPMSEESNISLLEKIVSAQRRILEEETGKPAEKVPQLWALYKEVQEYYDKGMRVPDDVTLLLCDDNWGNIRKLPELKDKPRAGGYGIYYHFDYVGGPRNYKWLNTNPITKVWEQMHLAREYGADRLWLVNVGDLKPMEFPIEFFLDYAWNPEQWTSDKLQDYTRLWAEAQFGAAHAGEIADIVSSYTRFNGRVKPELLSEKTYSLHHYREFERVTSDYRELLRRAEKTGKLLPAQYRDSYFQLVLHPVMACSNLYELYYAVALNRLYAGQRRASANELASKVRDLFARDAEISRIYNQDIAGGKWNHMMDQTHIGYTGWQQPETNIMPRVDEIEVPEKGYAGLALENTAKWWPESDTVAVLPAFSPWSQQSYFMELFNTGKTPLQYAISSGSSFVTVSSPDGLLEKDKRIEVSIDWKKAPRGEHQVPLAVKCGDRTYSVLVKVFNPAESEKIKGYVESNGVIAMEAAGYSRLRKHGNASWAVIPGYGKTSSAISIFPVTSATFSAGPQAPCAEYDFHSFSKGEVSVNVLVAPTIDFHNTGGMRYAVSIDDGEPQVVKINGASPDWGWERSVARNIRILTSKHQLKSEGAHTLKLWAIDPAVVVERIIIDAGGVKNSYLGPPESAKK